MIYGWGTFMGVRVWAGLVGSLVVIAVGVLGVLAVDRHGGRLSAGASGGGSARATEARVKDAYGRLPLRFEANRGQSDRRVRFLARGAGYSLFLTPTESVLSLSGGGASGGGGKRSSTARGAEGGGRRGAVLRTRLLGASARPRLVGEGRLAGTSNYLSGRDPSRWQRGVPGYGRVRYVGVYPGVDLVYYGRQGRLEYDFRVAPGADAGKIRLGLRGARRLSVDRSGDLLLSTAAGTVRQMAPVAYQRIGSGRRHVAARYVVEGGDRVGFRLGSYDRSRPLVIDPALVYSTYLGGARGGNAVSVVAADSSGAAYVAGSTTAVDLPTTSGAFDRTREGDPSNTFLADAFVTKLSPAGDALAYSTYLGGSGASDAVFGIAVDTSGRAYVTGQTDSSDFPTTVGSFQPSAPSSTNAFMSVLKADGSGLAYSTFLGGSNFTLGAGIAVDSLRHAYVTGVTVAGDFPTKAPAGETPFQTSTGGAVDGFVAKLDPDASTGPDSLVYSSYMGGNGSDSTLGVAVDGADNAYVTGATSSTDFPTKNAFQDTPGGNGDGFVAKVNPTGSALVYSTYLGGAAFDFPGAIALDSSDHAYVTGRTLSTDFPTATPFQPSHAGDPAVDYTSDAFVTKLAPDGRSLAYSSYLGGAGDDLGSGIAVTSAGAAYVAGSETINGTAALGSFPTVDPLAPAATNGESFVSAVKPDGSGLSFSTYLGGGGEENVGGSPFAIGGVAVDPAGGVYVAGSTVSTDFPTRNPLQAENLGRGVGDLRQTFVAKLAPVDPGAPLVTGLGRRSGPEGTSLVIAGRGFTGGSAVRFGEVAASTFTVDSDAQITAIAPAHAPGPVAVSVTTGQGTSPPNPIAMFTYAQGIWDLTGSLRVGRLEGEIATLLSDGKVLVAGGLAADRVTPRPAAELYDPATGRWTTTASMGTARLKSTATVLPDGRVLVAGGLDENFSPLSSAELYDPVGGTWSTTGSMADARSDHTATLLSDLDRAASVGIWPLAVSV